MNVQKNKSAKINNAKIYVHNFINTILIIMNVLLFVQNRNTQYKKVIVYVYQNVKPDKHLFIHNKEVILNVINNVMVV